MSKRKIVGAAVVAVGACALAGGLIASNMGFKLNKGLDTAGVAATTVGEPAPNTSLNGSNTIALPFNRQSGLNTAGSLKTDIGTSCVSVSKLLRASNLSFTYSGARSGTGSVDFALEEGVGYQVRVTAASPTTISYIVVGSDDPAFPLPLIVAGQTVPEGGTSLNGSNLYAYKYHSTATTAGGLKAEIGAQCASVSKLLLSNNLQFTYSGARSGTGSIDFPLVPGLAYTVRVTGASNVNYVASHY